MALNEHVSDLFYGLDFIDCIEVGTAYVFGNPPKGGLDLDRVKQKAAWFCEALEGAGGPRVDADELVENFYSRL